jgi:glyoxylase-like metal-dependent hydrolase (beta-lactamase superfamily II)
MAEAMAGVSVVDLDYLGRPEAIAAALIETPRGLAVVDPGPTVSLDALRAALAARGASVAELRWILLTHIHLDHAGGSGTLVRENPRLTVLVHEVGARHMADPSRLLESATRIYGAQHMDRLWGEFVPVPAANLRPLAGEETLDLGGRPVAVRALPGHARHHVAYLDRESGTAFVGDIAGERYPGADFVIPVTPPPDIDLEAWRSSWQALRAWRPDYLFLTHFGPFPDAAAHLDQIERRTEAWARQVRASLAEPLSDEARARAFCQAVDRELQAELPSAMAERYGQAAGVSDSWYGLARYWRKKEEAAAAATEG